MERVYTTFIEEHFESNRQMLFLSGPRQVGKTTLSVSLEKDFHYFNWDDQNDRQRIITGQSKVADAIGSISDQTIVFDELHKYADWKNFVKGFYDKYRQPKWKIIVTGSARLDTYRKGGDSLMGRYFHFSIFPLSVAELLNTNRVSETLIRQPKKIEPEKWETLLEFGGFPEPYLKANKRFHRQWSALRKNQFLQEDIRSLGTGYDLSKIEVLAELITMNATQMLNYSNLAKHVRVSVETIQRWIALLKQLSYCFTLRPWKKNISRSLLKEPKLYLTDWSQIKDQGKRNENLIANALLKAVTGWSDLGFGEFDLFYIRTKEKREVDFVVTRNQIPWFLVEVKTSQQSISPQLKYFQDMIQAKHAFQVTMNMPYQDLDVFTTNKPIIVPAVTLLSQLL